MAKKKKSTKYVKDIEVKEEQILKPKVKTDSYVLLRRLKVGDVWKEKGEKINLTKEGYRFFHLKRIV